MDPKQDAWEQLEDAAAIHARENSDESAKYLLDAAVCFVEEIKKEDKKLLKAWLLVSPK